MRCMLSVTQWYTTDADKRFQIELFAWRPLNRNRSILFSALSHVTQWRVWQRQLVKSANPLKCVKFSRNDGYSIRCSRLVVPFIIYIIFPPSLRSTLRRRSFSLLSAWLVSVLLLLLCAFLFSFIHFALIFYIIMFFLKNWLITHTHISISFVCWFAFRSIKTHELFFILLLLSSDQSAGVCVCCYSLLLLTF